ncbi:hypothetical protein GCM10009826_00690 [Humibacillus xanthopallidus]
MPQVMKRTDPPSTDSDADNPVVLMRLRTRVLISAGVALAWLFLMAVLTLSTTGAPGQHG